MRERRFRTSSAASAASDCPSASRRAIGPPAPPARQIGLIRRGEIGQHHEWLGASLAVEVGSARQPDQVAVAGFALRQQDNAVRLGGVSVDRSRHAGALATGDLAGGERDFDADDRLDTGIGAGNREFERAEQITCAR